MTEARSYMPDEGDASIEDMKQFALENGFKIVSAGNFLSNPLKTLKLMSGHYIVLITLTDKDGDVHKHACALTEHNGAMFIVDNMARQDVMEIGPKDRASQKDALKVFKNLFPGAAQLFVRAVYSVCTGGAAAAAAGGTR